MFDYKILLWIIGVLVTISWYLYYIKDVIKGRTKPHFFTWLVWWIATTIGFFIQIKNGWDAWSWITWVTSIFCFLIFFISVRNWIKNIKISDIVSFWLAIIAILLWLVADLPLYSVILISIIDALWFYPTYRKSFSKPWEETPFTFFTIWLKYTIALFALWEVSLLTALYPISMIISNYSFVIYVYIRRGQLQYQLSN